MWHIYRTPSRVVGLMCTSSKLITTSGLVTETGHIRPEGGWSPTSPEPPGQVALESTSESPPRAGYALLCMVIYDRKRYAFLIHEVLIAPLSAKRILVDMEKFLGNCAKFPHITRTDTLPTCPRCFTTNFARSSVLNMHPVDSPQHRPAQHQPKSPPPVIQTQ
jgi:hypothetical protein